MKKFTVIIITSVISLFACTQKHEKTTNATVKEGFPIEYVKKVTSKRKMFYNLDSLDLEKLVRIDSAFFRKWFDNTKVDNDTNWLIKYDYYSRYYFFDFKDVGKSIFFSIIDNNEIGYNLVYNYKFDKRTKQIEEVNLIAVEGGEGGESITNRLNFNEKGDVLNLITIREFENASFQNRASIKYDSIVTKMEFNHPKAIITQIDSVSRIDTIYYDGSN